MIFSSVLEKLSLNFSRHVFVLWKEAFSFQLLSWRLQEKKKIDNACSVARSLQDFTSSFTSDSVDMVGIEGPRPS